MDLVADASVVVKWFLVEEGSDRALLLRDDFVAGDVELHAPAVLPFEVLNALRYSSVLTEEAALQAQAVLDGYALRIHALEGTLARRAVHIAFAEDLSLYDAAYLALAKEIGARVVTADRLLVRAGGRSSIPLAEYESTAGP